MSVQMAQFINETDLPIMVEGFIQVMNGLNKLDSVLVMPDEECTIRSITGEWFLSTYFNEPKYRVMWAKNKMECTGSIGKFQNSPCIYSEYSWMDNDKFIVTYDGVGLFKFNYLTI